MEILAELFLILVVARAFGEGAERLGQPASVGQLIAGMVLAVLATSITPTVPVLSDLPSSEALEIVANVGIFLLVLVAGIELEPTEIVQHSGASFAIAVGGMLLPLTGGIALIWAFLPESDLRFVQALIVGTALSISAIPAGVKVLEDFGMLHTVVGRTIVAAAVIDDVFGLILLAVVIAIIESGAMPDLLSLGLLVSKVGIFFAVTVILGVHVYPRVHRGLKAMQIASIDLSALAAVGLAYGWLAEALGMHWIMGALMAGLYFEKSRVGVIAYNEIRLICGAMTNGFFGPLFFVFIGIQVDMIAVLDTPIFLAALFAVAMAGKIAGAAVPGLACGLSRREALSVGVGLSARGAIELVFVGIAYQSGVFAAQAGFNGIVDSLYSNLILVGILTTLAVPVILPRLLPRGPGTAST